MSRATLATSFRGLAVALVMASVGCSARGAGSGPGRDAGSGGGDVDSGMAPPIGVGETCENGLDDNGDGFIDEGCVCEAGGWEYCWTGPATRRGQGACRDGVQRCEPFGEFLAWGACEGAVLPTEEIPGNCIDEDCDGVDPACGSCGVFENCGPDGVDDDCDGYVDCADSDCASNPACSGMCVPAEFGELCDDGLDNDCDGYVDCGDPDCASATPCVPPPPPPGCTREFPFIAEIACGDGRDNDCDTNIDCADSDCRRPGSCGCADSETACSDGMDNDCNHSTDCADLSCQTCTAGSMRWCDDPMYCHWGHQTCDSTGHWGTCTETTDRPSDSCTSTFYSATCCVDAGACCENYPTDHSSIGTCSGSCRP